jgi:endopeptidase La
MGKNQKVVRCEDKYIANNDDILHFINGKVKNFEDIISKTIIITQRYKLLDVIGASELNICTQGLINLCSDIAAIKEAINPISMEKNNRLVNKLQNITNELSVIFKSFGTDSVDDLVSICFGPDFTDAMLNDDNREKYELIKKYVHPIGYKTVPWKDDVMPSVSNESRIVKNKIIEDITIAEQSCNLDCFDLARSSKSFQTKVYGIKFSIHNYDLRKTMIVCGIVDDIMVSCINNTYISNKLRSLRESTPEDKEFKSQTFVRFVECLTLKELLVFGSQELQTKFMGHINQVNLVKQKPMQQIVKEFVNNELYLQRLLLIQLLLRCDEPEFQYLAYLLYDLLSNDSNNNIDTVEQTLLFDSLPWNIKRFFRDAMKQTIQYTNNLCNFDNNKIPLEQQICLMKANDVVKEKAMVKLKEVKAKSEDSGSKARQYLEGLLRIPFNTFKEEPILSLIPNALTKFQQLIKTLHGLPLTCPVTLKNEYGNQEMFYYTNLLKSEYVPNIQNARIEHISNAIGKSKRQTLVEHIGSINQIIKTHKIKRSKLCHSGKNTAYMAGSIQEFITDVKDDKKILTELEEIIMTSESLEFDTLVEGITDDIESIMKCKDSTRNGVDEIHQILDEAVHGHEKAKRQVERVLGQWMSGEQTGYCFGFEGPPGVGKTSLAKLGLAHCLKDDEGNTRPFAFIAIGGASNSSTLDGHNYTYVGSTWGKIVDILMEKKCMNPIIFIDELDKVSKTEHGKEIIGILTHLIDSTQNNGFQDKYFTGIDLDLSRALFVFSYNDVDAIDRVLLDRIHRIKFDHLTVEDKLTICRKYILPELFTKMGLVGSVDISDDVLKFIINTYTCEPGVRKLKEVLFEIVGEINLDRLQTHVIETYESLTLTAEMIKTNYLKNRHEIREKKIHTEPMVGTINGLWANAMGRGGIIPIETSFYPCTNRLDLKLTGMQGDVMKESMTVAKTLAWSLTPKSRQDEMEKEFSESCNKGIHIHCPEGAVPKDGPSAGGAITVALYSLLNNAKIDNNIGMTGEISLQGKITAIGGLDLKIIGGIRAGIKRFIYPEENTKEFSEFMEKYHNNPIIEGIKFTPVRDIDEVLDLVLIK